MTPERKGEFMAALLGQDRSAQRVTWLDSDRQLWPVPAHTVSVFYEIGSRKAGARGGMSEAECAEVVRHHSLAILVGLTDVRANTNAH